MVQDSAHRVPWDSDQRHQFGRTRPVSFWSGERAEREIQCVFDAVSQFRCPRGMHAADHLREHLPVGRTKSEAEAGVLAAKLPTEVRARPSLVHL